MPGADFKHSLAESLKKSGFLNQLKAQLRSKLIDELRVRTNLQIAQNELKLSVTNQQEHSALPSIVVDFLRASGYEFSLSVFIPECGQTVLSRDEILSVYNLDHKRDIRDSKSILDAVMRIVSKESTESSAQTDTDDVHGKLYSLEEQYRLKQDSERANVQASLEERMIEFQKDCEKQYYEELRCQMEKFKKNEAERIREEERRSYLTEVQALEEKLVREDQERLRRLKQQEETLVDDIRRKQRDMEQQIHQDRQRLMEEYERLKSREETIKKEVDLQKKSLQLEEERLKRLQTRAEEDYAETQRQKQDYARKLQDEIQKYQLKFDKEHSDLIIQIKTKKAKLDTEKAIFAKRQSRMNHLEEQVRVLQHDLQVSNKRNTELTEVVEKLRRELDESKQGGVDVKMTYESFQSQAKAHQSALANENIQLKRQLVDLEKYMMKCERELSDAKAELGHTSKTQDKVKQQGLRWQQEAQELRLKLESQLNLNEEMARKLDEEILNSKQLERELADIRLLLHHTQNALNHEYKYGEALRSSVGPLYHHHQVPLAKSVYKERPTASYSYSSSPVPNVSPLAKTAPAPQPKFNEVHAGIKQVTQQLSQGREFYASVLANSAIIEPLKNLDSLSRSASKDNIKPISRSTSKDLLKTVLKATEAKERPLERDISIEDLQEPVHTEQRKQSSSSDPFSDRHAVKEEKKVMKEEPAPLQKHSVTIETQKKLSEIDLQLQKLQNSDLGKFVKSAAELQKMSQAELKLEQKLSELNVVPSPGTVSRSATPSNEDLPW